MLYKRTGPPQGWPNSLRAGEVRVKYSGSQSQTHSVEVIVQSDTDRVYILLGINLSASGRYAEEKIIIVIELHITIFNVHRPITPEAVFDPATQSPTSARVRHRRGLSY